jgi:hypothetical protein
LCHAVDVQSQQCSDAAWHAKRLAHGFVSLTILGALVLALRDLRRPREATYDDVLRGFPRREAWIGFPLIALGSVLQIVGVTLA